VRFDEEQTKFVAEETRNYLLPSDMSAFSALLSNRRAFPLTRLYHHLFASTHRTIDVITPNYDRLAEYAADAGEFSHFTGFSYGHLQTRARDPKTRVHIVEGPVRTVCVWKVHGSLDWFRNDEGQIVGARGCHQIPKGYAAVMVTPGIDKYRLTHAEPFRTIFASSDAAIEKARAYLCVGYGFNDLHLQEKLVERCNVDAVPIVILTKMLTTKTKEFLDSGRFRRYLALEESPAGTCVYSNEEPAGADLPGVALWQLQAFLDGTIGGGK